MQLGIHRNILLRILANEMTANPTWDTQGYYCGIGIHNRETNARKNIAVNK